MVHSATQSLYDSKDRSYFGAVRRNVTERLLDNNLGRLLDVGGGDGATVRFLVDAGRIDSAVVMDPFTRCETDQSIVFLKNSADDRSAFEALNRHNEPFDTVFFLDVLEHLVDPWEVLKWTKQVHKSGGRLVVCMPNARFVALIVPLVLWGRFDYKPSGIMDRTHIRWFTKSTIIELIESAGYRIDRIDAYIEPRVATVNKLTLGIFKGFFEYQYIVHATKID